METSPLICRANQWNGFDLIGTSAMKVLKASQSRANIIRPDLGKLETNGSNVV